MTTRLDKLAEMVSGMAKDTLQMQHPTGRRLIMIAPDLIALARAVREARRDMSRFGAWGGIYDALTEVDAAFDARLTELFDD